MLRQRRKSWEFGPLSIYIPQDRRELILAAQQIGLERDRALSYIILEALEFYLSENYPGWKELLRGECG